ncbi:MAG: serine/threonine protein phosphatase, partial [Negativibacillus massiliensis]|nr:serine/threonine protein phosphatase [Negativibacillus massiliensis]
MQRWKWSWKKKKDSEEMGRGYTAAVQTGPIKGRPFYQLEQAGMMDAGENQLFDQIRQAVPLVDASINKIIRLVGGFEVICSNKEGQRELDEFCAQVPVGASSVGLTQFLYCYLDNLLTYGNAA